MPAFTKQSTRPLTAESYRRAANLAREICDTLQWYGTLAEPTETELRHLTRAIKDLAAHSARLLERHKEKS